MSRKARKQNANKYRKQKGGDYLKLIQGGALQRTRKKEVNIVPRNFHQDDLLGLIEDKNINIVFATGPAGTGKTFISTLAGIRELKNNKIDKFVVTRPAVSVDEQHGFLPGTLQEKMAPWTRPIMDCFEEYYTPDQIEFMFVDYVSMGIGLGYQYVTQIINELNGKPAFLFRGEIADLVEIVIPGTYGFISQRGDCC